MSGGGTLTDRFLLIGAGPIGLGMAWELRRRGLRFDQVEARQEPGGVWVDGVYESVRTVSPRSLSGYPARPLPAAWPVYLSLGQVQAYLADFAREEGLLPGIAFGTRVERAEPRPDETWQVRFAGGRTAVYKGVISCIGHNWDPVWPTMAGEFAGERLHAGAYRNFRQLEGKRVLVVGLGQSGADIALDASRHGRCAHLSARHGRYLVPRDVDGRPFMERFPGWAPHCVQAAFVRRVYARHVPDAAALGLPAPARAPLEEVNLCLTDDLPDALRAHRVRLQTAIVRVEGRRVFFADGRHDEYDLLVCATGYKVSFPFLPEGFVPMTNEKTPRLYLGGVLPLFRHLYLVGSLEGVAGFGTGASLHAEIVCDLIKNQEKLAVPLGSAARWLGYPCHRTNLTSYGRVKQVRRMIPFWLWVARVAHVFRRTRWLERHRVEWSAWLAAQGKTGV